MAWLLGRSVLVVADAAVLACRARVEGMLLERLVRAGPWPPVGNLLDLAFGGVLHDLLAERIAFLAHDVLQELTFQVRVSGEDSIRHIGAPHIQVAVLEATLTLVERVEGLGLVRFQRDDGFLQHGLGFLLRAVLRLRRQNRNWQRESHYGGQSDRECQFARHDYLRVLKSYVGSEPAVLDR